MRRDSSVSNETVVLNGNLTVTNGSRLELTDTVIRINATFDGEFAVVVENGSTLVAENVTFTRASDYAYGFVFAAGTNGSLVDSVVAYVGGAEAGLALHAANVTLVNTTLRDSPFGVRLYAPATLSGNTFVNTTVGVALVDTLAANDVAADNTFENSSVARIRHLVNTTVEVVNQEDEAVEGARVWLNDTLERNWLDAITDAAGASGPHEVADWEVASDGTYRTLEPYNLTAMKYGRRNLTTATPSTDPTPTIELVLRPDLVVVAPEIAWGVPVPATAVPAGRDNATAWRWTIRDSDASAPAGWAGDGFNDSGWDLAPAPFGDQELGDVSYNTAWNDNNIAYFRYPLTLPAGTLPTGGSFASSANNFGTYYVGGEAVFDDWRDGGGHGAEYWNDVSSFDGALLRVGAATTVAARVEETGNTQWFDAQLAVELLAPGRSALLVDSLVTVAVPVHNRGAADAVDVVVRLYNGSTLVGSRTFDLGRDDTRVAAFAWDPAERGNATLTVEVDPADAIVEENETNNNASATAFVGRISLDLSGAVANAALRFNETRRFNYTVTNSGDVHDNVTLSVMGPPGGWETAVEPLTIYLAPGASRNATLAVTPLRGAPQGNYTFALSVASSFTGSESTIATVVPAGRDNDTFYRYLIGTEDPDDWFAPGFDDGGWDSGPAPFGDENVEGVEPGTDWTGNYNSVKTRHWFALPEGAEIVSASLRTAFNNYVTAYLNGQQIYGEQGSRWQDASYWNENDAVDPDLLNAGANLLAVRGRERTGSQWLDLELRVEILLSRTVSTNLTINIRPTHDFELDRDADAYDHRFNTTVQYPLTITNFGNLNETVDLNLTVARQSGPWSANLSHDNLTLAPGEEADIYIEVVGGNFIGGEYLNLSLTSTSREAPSLLQSYVLNLTAYPPTYDFDALADEPYRIIDPGDNHTFLITLRNLGNLDDTYDVSITSNDTTNFTLGNYTATLALPYETDGQVLVELIVSDSAHRKAFSGLNVTLTSRGSGAQRWVALDARPYYPPDMTPPASTMEIDAPYDSGTYFVNERWFELDWRLTDDSDDLRDYRIDYSTNDGGGFGPWVRWGGNFTNQSARFPGVDGLLYRFRSLARDEYGNVETKSDYDLVIRMDLTPPASRLWVVENPGPVTRLEGLTLKWGPVAAGDYVTYTVAIQYFVVGTTPSGWSDLLRDTLTTQYWFAPPRDRTYQFRVLATDRAGNVETKSGPDVTVRIDRQPPVVTLETLPAEWDRETITLTLTEALEPNATLGLQWASVSEAAIDSLGAGLQYELAWSSDLALTWENGSATHEGLDGYWYYFRLRPTDAAGNAAERDSVELLLDSDGSANQTFTLAVAVLPFEVGGDLAVRVDEDGDGYHERLLEAGSDPTMLTASQYFVDYDARTLVLGDNDTGYQPTVGDARLQVTFAGYDGRTLVDLRPPGAPRELDYTLVSNTTVRLQWRNGEDAVAYRVERTTNATLGWETLGIVAPGEGDYTQFTDEVEQLQRYLYRVVAIDRMGYEKASEPLEVDLTVADAGEVVVEPGAGWIAWAMALGLALFGLTVAAVYGWRHRPETAKPGPGGTTRRGAGRRGRPARQRRHKGHRAAARQPVLEAMVEPLAQGTAEAVAAEAEGTAAGTDASAAVDAVAGASTGTGVVAATEASVAAEGAAAGTDASAAVGAAATGPSPFAVPEGSEFARVPQLVCSGCGAVFARPEGETATCDGCGTVGPLP